MCFPEEKEAGNTHAEGGAKHRKEDDEDEEDNQPNEMEKWKRKQIKTQATINQKNKAGRFWTVAFGGISTGNHTASMWKGREPNAGSRKVENERRSNISPKNAAFLLHHTGDPKQRSGAPKKHPAPATRDAASFAAVKHTSRARPTSAPHPTRAGKSQQKAEQKLTFPKRPAVL